jgi:KDO2-lipid IV(A) lauroyltransferase
MPLRPAIKLHKAFGRALGGIARHRRRVVKRNLEICFPELDDAALEALTRGQFENIGACFAEIGFAWFASPARLAKLFEIEGREHLDAALAKGKGVILFSGHFTTLEICSPQVKALVPLFTFMFRPRHNALLNEFQMRGRLRASHVSFANTEVRAMVRTLRQNAVVWYAPDQVPADGTGVLLPFFGEPAMTNTATSRLARVSGATVIPFFFRRLPGDSRYLLRFSAPLDDLPSDDPSRDTARLTAVLEGFVRECPDQYFWTHRKFKGRPAGLPNAYSTSAAE